MQQRLASSHALRRALAALALLSAAASPAAAQSIDRGRALYETRCTACHERSVHQRDSRKAQDFASLRREVARWSGTAAGEWKADEIDAVTTYLNDRYYRFPCPPAACTAAPRAGGSPRGA